MNKYSDTITNERGDVLPNHRAQVVDSTGAIVTIYSDKSGTRFTDASGNIVNYATAENNGRVSFYFVAAEGQVLQTLDTAGELKFSEPDFADNFILSNLPGNIAQSAVTGLTTDLAAKADGAATTAALAAKAATADLASTDAGKGAALVGFKQSSASATARDVLDKLREKVSVKDFGAVGDGVADDTAAIQAAIDYVSANNIGELYAPAGTYSGNWTIKSNCTIVGAGRSSTTFVGLLDAPTFAVSTTVSTVRFGWRECSITGNLANTSNIGISIDPQAVSTFADGCYIQNVVIDGCGAQGLYAHGTSTSGPFVQKLRLRNVDIRNSGLQGIWLHGTVIEVTIDSCQVTSNGPTSGATANMQISSDGASAGGRVAIRDTLINHFKALNAGNPGTALWLDAARNVTIDTCDIESGDPFIDITSALSANIYIQNSRFASSFACSQMIKIQDVDGLVIDNNSFAAGGTANRIIEHTTTGVRGKNIDIRQNKFTGTITLNAVKTNNQNTSTATSMNLNNALQFFSAGSSFNLATINDPEGNTDFVNGQKCTIWNAHATNTVTLKHGTGNLYLTGDVDFVMGQNDVAEFFWAGDRWIEIGRKA